MDSKEKKNFFKKITSELDQINGSYKKEKFKKNEALSATWVLSNEEITTYYQSFFFFEKDYLYTLNFVSEHQLISNFIMTELLNSFQVKE